MQPTSANSSPRTYRGNQSLPALVALRPTESLRRLHSPWQSCRRQRPSVGKTRRQCSRRRQTHRRGPAGETNPFLCWVALRPTENLRRLHSPRQSCRRQRPSVGYSEIAGIALTVSPMIPTWQFSSSVPDSKYTFLAAIMYSVIAK